jgi:hypothetical protein
MNMRISLTRIITFLLIVHVFTGSAVMDTDGGSDIIVKDSSSLPVNQREALLILPGFGSKVQGLEDIQKYFQKKGYDLYMPKYIERDSIGQCMATLDRFINRNKLNEYKKVHVFSYIVGSWTLNKWLKVHPQNNIASIVYDRSPLQERAPYALVTDIPFLIRMVSGKIMKEFSLTPYSPIVNDSTKNIAILMECRATKIIIKHKKAAMSLGELDWSIAGRNQDCDDYLYTLNNHDDMYHDFSVIGPEIFHFIKAGKFSDSAQHVKPDIDPFTAPKNP